MSLPAGVRRLLRLGGVQRDVDEELSFHFGEAVAELEASGWSRAAAAAEARRRFGDVATYRRQLQAIDRRRATRNQWAVRWDALGQSLRFAVRALLRSPGLTLGVVLAFALGIGANATMYSVIERLLLRPPAHIVEPHSVRRVYVEEFASFMGERYTSESHSFLTMSDLQPAASLVDVAAYSVRQVTVGRGLEAEELPAVSVTANYFDLLGVRPLLGRFFTEEEESIGGPSQIVIGHNYWQRAHGGERSVLGRTIDFGYGPYEIIGVAPADFTGMDLTRVDLWLPLQGLAGKMSGTEWYEEPAGRNWQWVQVVTRLAPGVSDERARAEATALHLAGYRTLIEQGEKGDDARIVLAPVHEARGPNATSESTVARLLLGVALVVLIIACINVANLLFARTLRQSRELAVRLALGISRRRMFGQIVLEGVLLALVGGGAALLVARWGGELVRSFLLPEVVWEQGVITRGVVLVVIVLSIFAGVMSGLLPALQAARGAVADTLRRAGAGGVTRTTSRVRIGLALLQTALSVILLVGAGLFVRSLDRARALDLGFDPKGLYYASARAPREAFTDEEVVRLYGDGAVRLARLPGVRAVGVTSTLPFYSRRSVRLRAEGVDSIPVPASGGPYVHEVGYDYFAAMGLEIVRGRAFRDRDRGAAGRVALISARMAARLWPGQDPLGKCLFVGRDETRCSAIVGVVEDSRNVEIAEAETFQYYVPLAQAQIGARPNLFLIRVARDRPELVLEIRRTISELDPRVRYASVEPMQSRIDPQTRSWQLGAMMLTVFGLLALLVAAIGLYSVLSFDVAQRTRELGLRAALGASTSRLLRMVVARAVAVTAFGVALGVLSALAITDRVEPLLFQIPPHDPLTFLAVIVALLLVAILASSIPGWRAARVDPNIALRAD